MVLKGRDFARPTYVRCRDDASLASMLSAPQLVVRAQEREPQAISLFGRTAVLPRREWLCGKAHLIARDELSTDAGFRMCELVLDDDAPVTMTTLST